jgi:hypothetical protein
MADHPHLKHVAWDPTSASPIECAIGLTQCIANGHFLPELRETPGLVVRNVGRIADFAAEQFVHPMAFGTADEEQAFDTAIRGLADAAGVVAAGPLTRYLILIVARQLAEMLLRWLDEEFPPTE